MCTGGDQYNLKHAPKSPKLTLYYGENTVKSINVSNITCMACLEKCRL